ncbi:MAG: hypothetical protein HY718_08945, partial [Planctomycetes bacterium]|nr:hypothetical protein [Planctomycetota bacterium]
MRTYLLLVVVLTSGLVPRASLLAAPYRLRFRDSTTGLAVSPAALLLDGEEQVALPDANGITTLDVAAGEH